MTVDVFWFFQSHCLVQMLIDDHTCIICFHRFSVFFLSLITVFLPRWQRNSLCFHCCSTLSPIHSKDLAKIAGAVGTARLAGLGSLHCMSCRNDTMTHLKQNTFFLSDQSDAILMFWACLNCHFNGMATCDDLTCLWIAILRSLWYSTQWLSECQLQRALFRCQGVSWSWFLERSRELGRIHKSHIQNHHTGAQYLIDHQKTVDFLKHPPRPSFCPGAIIQNVMLSICHRHQRLLTILQCRFVGGANDETTTPKSQGQTSLDLGRKDFVHSSLVTGTYYLWIWCDRWFAFSKIWLLKFLLEGCSKNMKGAAPENTSQDFSIGLLFCGLQTSWCVAVFPKFKHGMKCT